jgi:hypothetical protein
MIRRKAAAFSVFTLIALVSFTGLGCDPCSSCKEARRPTIVCGQVPPSTTGAMFVSDSSNSRVLEYLPPFTTGMSASAVFGQPDFNTSGGNATQNGMGNPEAVAVDGYGDLWAGDFFFGRAIVFVPPFSTGMSASVVTGQDSFDTGNSGSGPAGLSGASSVALDISGNLYVVDPNNNRVLIYNPPLTTGMSASVVIGQPDLTSSAPATTAQGLRGPLGVTIGP